VDESSGAASATPGASVLDFRNLPTHADLIDGFRDTDDTHFNAAAQIQMGTWYAEKYVAVSAPNPGDFDGDGDVDGNDFLFWQRGDSPNGATASDLLEWETNFGNTSVAVLASVPEPSTGLLFLIGASWLWGRRRV